MSHLQKEQQKSERLIRMFRGCVVLALSILCGYFVYVTTIHTDSKYAFRLGLDLAGGSRLVYEADVSSLRSEEVPALMNVLREVIERRINVFGVAEPLVQVERSSIVAEQVVHRLVVELPGVTDIEDATTEIGKTPLLEFKLIDAEKAETQASIEQAIRDAEADGKVVDLSAFNRDDVYKDTALTGRYLKSAELVFGQSSGVGLANEPIVSITFDDQGAALFEEITRNNVGEQLAIFLDGAIMSAPRINEAISGGRAVISGDFTPEEARELVRNLNFGALPVPITLASTQTIGSTLGAEALERGAFAGAVGLAVLIAFMILWYRLPGVIASLALVVYVIIMLALFKIIPVVLTAAGVAGFILSIGLAVDANILIAERMKEEFRAGKNVDDAIAEGFARAWLAIRDSNFTHVIVGIILFWFGTALIKGFAFVFVIGVFASMFSAITISRTLLMALPITRRTAFGRYCMGTGLTKE